MCTFFLLLLSFVLGQLPRIYYTYVEHGSKSCIIVKWEAMESLKVPDPLPHAFVVKREIKRILVKTG